MARPTTNTEALRSLFKKQKIATLDELKQAIGTTSTMTVFRRLKELGYRTSYSHRGKFYTLANIPRFDNDGLWSYQSVGFSQFGNLLHTTQQFVEQVAAGFTASELRNLLHVEVKQSLLQLVGQKQLRREKVGHHFVYLAPAKERRTRQKQQRQEYQAAWEIGASALREESSQELNAAVILFYSLLDEKQRRLYAGLESFKLGHGGDRKTAEFLGLDVHTVARGRRELFCGDVGQEGVRKGAPAEKRWKKTPQVIAAIAQLLEHDTAGDPISGLKWTRKTTEKVADQLKRLKINVSPKTVGRLLKDMGYSLRVNYKKVESGGKNPPPPEVRDRQFEYISRMSKKFARRGNPIVSGDGKKKEKVGNFKNPGASWEKKPYEVYDHDFPKDAVGKAVPYSVYDTLANLGFVVVGISHETPAFVVRAIVLWWRECGRKMYPDTEELLILVDSGGGNGWRSRGWKYHLQYELCDRYGLTVTICHYPPGASKWNPADHRLHSEISKNWAGKPLDSYETVLKYIRTTKTKTGLHVRARLERKPYATGERIVHWQMAELCLTPHKTNPNWNYTLAPHPS